MKVIQITIIVFLLMVLSACAKKTPTHTAIKKKEKAVTKTTVSKDLTLPPAIKVRKKNLPEKNAQGAVSYEQWKKQETENTEDSKKPK